MAKRPYSVLDRQVRILSIEEDFLPLLGILSIPCLLGSVLLGSVTDILTGMSVLILLEIILFSLAKTLQDKFSVKDIKKIICSRKLPMVISCHGMLMRDRITNQTNH